MKNKSLTLTIVCNMTSNYGEGLGNISTIQKVFREGKIFPIRSRESLKNGIMSQSGMYEDLVVKVDGATQKEVSQEKNASNCRALEGGYMNTSKKLTYVRNSSFYVTDAIGCDPFRVDSRFHNNLYLASAYAKANGLNLQNEAKQSGLMPYNYEYDKSLKIYSFTIDLTMIGKDENFNEECDNKEKALRVNLLLEAIKNLSLVVKGNLDNSEPLFIVGGLSKRMTHQFENTVRVKDGKLHITKDLKERIKDGYACGLLEGDNFDNEMEIISELNPLSIGEFFKNLENSVNEYYGV
ncbi:CRISPR-associated autoregulator, Cst2 family [Cetobacterium ceti]|uniref:CRISPR-associated autoregulator, Cst2 family n=1 Tax=Cetobacterium ceti TaxID=180163 RepID=A0A1T4MAP6_9FUSO|nr:type I-B CRISPR-associated protein Cas7/Cst2/DevR [Cetobacterium ceti]SJZ63838.1 CRISPR-associated autoregulator, Cst2 family [Cetobacterium ceti]